jgi:hypothetical protein
VLRVQQIIFKDIGFFDLAGADDDADRVDHVVGGDG